MQQDRLISDMTPEELTTVKTHVESGVKYTQVNSIGGTRLTDSEMDDLQSLKRMGILDGIVPSKYMIVRETQVGNMFWLIHPRFIADYVITLQGDSHGEV